MFGSERAGPHPLKAEVTLLHRQTGASREMPSRVTVKGGEVGGVVGWRLLPGRTNNTGDACQEVRSPNAGDRLDVKRWLWAQVYGMF